MSLAEFRAAFPGESQQVEFKRGTSMEQMQSTAVAFSNADGGVVLIGVQDDGAIDRQSPRCRHAGRRSSRHAGCPRRRPLRIE
jgi:predicted HTH transcriptional regulator